MILNGCLKFKNLWLIRKLSVYSILMFSSNLSWSNIIGLPILNQLISQNLIGIMMDQYSGFLNSLHVLITNHILKILETLKIKLNKTWSPMSLQRNKRYQEFNLKLTNKLELSKLIYHPKMKHTSLRLEISNQKFLMQT